MATNVRMIVFMFCKKAFLKKRGMGYKYTFSKNKRSREEVILQLIFWTCKQLIWWCLFSMSTYLIEQLCVWYRVCCQNKGKKGLGWISNLITKLQSSSSNLQLESSIKIIHFASSHKKKNRVHLSCNIFRIHFTTVKVHTDKGDNCLRNSIFWLWRKGNFCYMSSNPKKGLWQQPDQQKKVVVRDYFTLSSFFKGVNI